MFHDHWHPVMAAVNRTEQNGLCQTRMDLLVTYIRFSVDKYPTARLQLDAIHVPSSSLAAKSRFVYPYHCSAARHFKSFGVVRL